MPLMRSHSQFRSISRWDKQLTWLWLKVPLYTAIEEANDNFDELVNVEIPEEMA